MTNTAQHTPCWPCWKLEERKVMRPMGTKPQTEYTLINWDGTIIASLFDVKDGGKAARLIAAAPDMYEALKLAYELCNAGQPLGNDDLNQLYTAINKAEGK